MKSIYVITLCLFTVGCGLFAPPRFDNNEYFFFTELETHARFLVDDCNQSNIANKRISAMLFRSETLQTYSYYLPNHTEIYGGAKLINKQLIEFNDRYNKDIPPSPTYCKLKAKTLVKEIRRVLETVAKLGITE